MATTRITSDAQKQLDALPVTIRNRVAKIIVRLNEWPVVAGAKPLRGNLSGRYRIRTGDYRVQFYVTLAGDPVIEKVGNRDRFYDE
jgi:mRNA-degrading endonuclease RelE of RelBE toxin-antitoxin system